MKRWEEQRTREFLLDRTKISAVHSLDQLRLVEREYFITDGEQWHLSRVFKFCGITVNKRAQRSTTVEKRTLAIPPTKRLSMTPHHILPRRILNTEIVATETPHLLLHDERLDVGHAKGGIEADGRVEGLEEDGLGGGMAEESHRGFVCGCREMRCVCEGRWRGLHIGRGMGRCAKRSTYASSASRNRVERRGHSHRAFSVRIVLACLVIVFNDLGEESRSERREGEERWSEVGRRRCGVAVVGDIEWREVRCSEPVPAWPESAFFSRPRRRRSFDSLSDHHLSCPADANPGQDTTSILTLNPL